MSKPFSLDAIIDHTDRFIMSSDDPRACPNRQCKARIRRACKAKHCQSCGHRLSWWRPSQRKQTAKASSYRSDAYRRNSDSSEPDSGDPDYVIRNRKRNNESPQTASEWAAATIRKGYDARCERERLNHEAHRRKGLSCPYWESCSLCTDEQCEEQEEASRQQAPCGSRGRTTAEPHAHANIFNCDSDEEWGDLLPATWQHCTPSPEPKKQPMSDGAEAMIESARQTGVKTENVEVKLEESETMALQKCARSGRDIHVEADNRSCNHTSRDVAG